MDAAAGKVAGEVGGLSASAAQHGDGCVVQRPEGRDVVLLPAVGADGAFAAHAFGGGVENGAAFLVGGRAAILCAAHHGEVHFVEGLGGFPGAPAGRLPEPGGCVGHLGLFGEQGFACALPEGGGQGGEQQGGYGDLVDGGQEAFTAHAEQGGAARGEGEEECEQPPACAAESACGEGGESVQAGEVSAACGGCVHCHAEHDADGGAHCAAAQAGCAHDDEDGSGAGGGEFTEEHEVACREQQGCGEDEEGCGAGDNAVLWGGKGDGVEPAGGCGEQERAGKEGEPARADIGEEDEGACAGREGRGERHEPALAHEGGVAEDVGGAEGEKGGRRVGD